MTNSYHLIGNISTIYMTTAQRPNFWLQHIIQLLCYCASPNYLFTANRPIISPMEIV